MPMWYHWYTNQSQIRKLAGMNLNTTKCLRDNHWAWSVGNFEELATLLTSPDHEVRRGMHCECNRCITMKFQDGCADPHKCAACATSFLSTLPSKWDPRVEHLEDFEDVCHKLTMDAGLSLGEDLIPFDKRVTSKGALGEVFCIFTSGMSVIECLRCIMMRMT